MEDLCGALTLDRLIDNLKGNTQDAGMFASWNIRWITDPLTPAAMKKRWVLERILARQQVILLQETHWNEQQGAVWGSGLMAHTVVVIAPARTCPLHGGPQGGVAILVPQPLVVVHQAIMVPGCVVQARIREPAPLAFTFVSIYPSPTERGPTLLQFLDHPAPEAPVLLGGD